MIEQIIINILAYPMVNTLQTKYIIDWLLSILGFITMILIFISILSSKTFWIYIWAWFKLISYYIGGVLYVCIPVGISAIQHKYKKNEVSKEKLRRNLLWMYNFIASNRKKISISSKYIDTYHITQEDIKNTKPSMFINLVKERIQSHSQSLQNIQFSKVLKELQPVKYILIGFIIMCFSYLILELIFNFIHAINLHNVSCNENTNAWAINILSPLWFNRIIPSSEQKEALLYILSFIGLYANILFMISWFFYMVSFGKRICIFISKLFMSLGFLVIIGAWIASYIFQIYCK